MNSCLLNKFALPFITLAALICSTPAHAQMMGFGLGVNQTQVVSDSTGASTQIKPGASLNFIFLTPVADHLEGRLGVSYAQKGFGLGYSGSQPDYEFKGTYLDVPMTIGFAPSPMITVFGGAVMSMNLTKECTINYASNSCTPTGVTGANLGLTLGTTFKIVNEFGIELAYTKYSSKLLEHATEPSTIGIQLYYLIE